MTVPDSIGASPLPSPPAAVTVPTPPLRPRLPRRRTEGGGGREARSLRRADALVASGKVEKALAHLRKLVEVMPDSTRAYLRMASLLREIHRSSEAYHVLRDTISRAPNSPEAREALAEICLEMGRWDEAIQQSNALLILLPRSLFARDVLSAAYLQRGLIDKALRTTDEMIALDPNDASNHFKRGVLLQQKGRVGAALAAFQRVVHMDPESDVADESRSAIEMLDNYQIRQVVMLAVEDVPFRLALLKECATAVTSRGFFLSERGVAALSQIRFDDLPDAPPGWRHYHYH
jgi:tetratricopeptide (TPR) repeat protein